MLAVGMGVGLMRRIGGAPVPPAALNNGLRLCTGAGEPLWASDYLERTASVPNAATGFLFCGWTRTKTAPTSYPYSYVEMPNCYPIVLHGTNWHCECINGNRGATSSSNASYQLNTTFTNAAYDWPAWGDTTNEIYTGLPEAPFGDWVRVVWQFIIPTDGSDVILRQRVSWDGTTWHPSETTLTVATLGFTPGALTSMTFGGDAGTSAGGTPFDVYGFRIKETGTAPSDAELDAIFANADADAAAWGDWLLDWPTAANLTDRSGNSRDLSLMAGATLYEATGHPVL